MAEKKSWTEIPSQLPEPYLESVSVLKKQAENVYLFFSLKGQPKNLKTGCACIKNTNFIFRGFQKKYSSHDPVPLNI